MKACAGIKVLEIAEGFGVASLCGQLFAGLGASVRTVDMSPGPPAGLSESEAESASYRSYLLFGSKEAVVATNEDEYRALIDWADVILFDRNATETPVLLKDINSLEIAWPKKIFCCVSLYGAASTRSSWIGNELVAEAAGALMACNGYPERPPVTSGLPYALHTTALFGLSAVLTALWERDSSGLGQVVDLAIIDCIVAILGNFLPSYFLSGRLPTRIGNRHTIAAPWNIYPALDGSVVICTGTGGTGWWAKVMAVLDRPDLVNDPRYATETDRVRNVDEVDAIMTDWTSLRTMQEVVAKMTARGIPVSEISTIEAVLSDPHYRDLRMMTPLSDFRDHNGNLLPGAGVPIKVGAWNEDPSADRASKADAVVQDTLRGIGDREGGGALAGIRVLEFASRTSVPLAGRLLGEFGAEIVKIEPVKGDALRGAGQQIGGSSYLFHINNAGKRSVLIDPTTATGKELILDLVRQADVFLENLAPGSLEKMGLGYEALNAANPNIVYCSVSGFGIRSSHGSKRALDTVVQAACGLMYMTGYPDHFPVKLGISAVDLTTAVAVMASALSGLRERLRTGKGLHLDLAMADIGVWMTQRAWPEILCESKHPIRQGNRSPYASPHNIYTASDGRFVAIACETDEQWRSLVSLIGDESLTKEEFNGLEARLEARDLIDEAVGRWVRSSPAEAIAAACQAESIPAAPVRELSELTEDADVATRAMIFNFEDPAAGKIRLLGNPMKLSRTPPHVRSGAPRLGENTREVVTRWLNISDDRYASLAETGAVGQNSRPILKHQSIAS